MYSKKLEEQIRFQPIYQEDKSTTSIFKNPFFWIGVLGILLIGLLFLLFRVLGSRGQSVVSLEYIMKALPSKA